MELRTITNAFQPDQVVDGYDSLVWTERYREAGDFVLKTPDIDRIKELMPLGKLVGVKGSTDCKIVESHTIEKDEDGGWAITAEGRSFESFFENRACHEGQVRMFTLGGDFDSGTPTYQWEMASTGESSAKYVYEIIKYKSMESTDAATYIPNVTCTMAANTTIAAGMPRRYHTVQLGNVYERILEILASDDLGIRSILPAVGQTNLTFNIYKGVDVSANVILSTSQGHFESATYVQSIREYKNAAVAHSDWDWVYVNKAPAGGLARRFGWVNAQDITHNSSPGANADEKELQSRVAAYLAEHKQPNVFSGEISVDIPYVYGQHYNMGDIIMVVADYGLNQKMRVSEYIRTEDKNGEKAYPVLEQPS